MNRFLFVLVLFVAAAIGLGFYLKWFHIGSESSDGKDRVTLTVNEDKIKEDSKKAQENMQNLGHKETDKAGTATTKSKAPAVPPGQVPQNER